METETSKTQTIQKAGLAENIREAQLLLTYAAQSGLTLDENIISVIVRSKHMLTPDKWTSDIETEFWLAFNELAKLVHPVSVASLKAIHPFSEQELEKHEAKKNFFKTVYNYVFSIDENSSAKRSVASYKKWSLVILAALLFVQIYWLVGSELTADIEKAMKTFESERKKIENLVAEKEVLAVKIENLVVEQESLAVERIHMQELAPDSDRFQFNEMKAEYKKIKEKQDELTTKLDKLEEKQDELTTNLDKLNVSVEKESYRIDANHEMLNNWRKVWHFVFFIQKWKTEKPQDSDNMKRKFILLKESQIVVDVLHRYVLPLLYGLLGAMAYVLRKLSLKIRALTYEEDSNIRYGLRIQLGALSGLAVGWFIDAGSSSLVSSLSPLAVAFLAGYSIEVLFAIMDRFISAFTIKENPKDIKLIR
ncbi:MAG: hypothetical protein GY749_25860 [Desulfobacteraceae bacterium]|nr:hypothetical protein [Desulfobacteraceae bacterium]